MKSKGVLLGLGLSVWMAAALICPLAASAQSADPPAPSYPTNTTPQNQERGWFSEKARGQREHGGGQHHGGKKERMRRMLSKFDANHDGRLDEGERSAAMQAIMNNPKVRQRLAQDPGREAAFRAKLEKRLSKWHGGDGGNDHRGRRRNSQTQTRPLG